MILAMSMRDSISWLHQKVILGVPKNRNSWPRLDSTTYLHAVFKVTSTVSRRFKNDLSSGMVLSKLS